MKTLLNAQEVYLIERYISLDYYREMRDAWRSMLDVLEQALGDFMLHLPPDYRDNPLPEQPDIVWGEQVLPNFRDTMLYLEMGYKKLEAGDYSGLHSASVGITGDFRGVKEYSDAWLQGEARSRYFEFQGQAYKRASNIESTIQQRFSIGSLTFGLEESKEDPLNLPTSLPVYRLNPKIKVGTDQLITQTGIYLPDADDSAANFLIADAEKLAPEAEAWANMDDYYAAKARGKWLCAESHYIPTTWTLIERISDTGTPIQPPGTFRLRYEAGKTCPKEGWWWSPAGGEKGRRFFKEGEMFPAFDSDYGDTIWQWDEQQNS